MDLKQTSMLAIGGIVAIACQNNDAPEHEPTLITVTSDDDGGGSTSQEGDGGADETTDGKPTPQCWPEHSPADPALYQCVGVGMGGLTWEEYVLSWKAASLADPVVIELPPQRREDPNAQACCESDAEPPAVTVGCIEDCARAACNLAIERLQAKLADPPDLCGGACLDRFEDTLTTWISFIEANYEDCLQVARGEAGAMGLPDPESASDPVPTGAGRLGELTLACTMDATQPAWKTEHTCETSSNGATMAAWERWSCPSLQGAVEIDGPLGVDWAPLSGSLTLRRSVCASSPCWLAIESLELEATLPIEHAYAVERATASLAYQGFGRYDPDTGDGTIATGMLGLDVAMHGSPASTTPIGFTIANSDVALLELGAGTFELVDAYFAWSDGSSVTITTDVATCSCTSCT